MTREMLIFVFHFSIIYQANISVCTRIKSSHAFTYYILNYLKTILVMFGAYFLDNTSWYEGKNV